MTKIRFEKKYKLDKIASSDFQRVSLNRLIVLDDKRLAATDGTMAAIVPADADGPVPENGNGFVALDKLAGARATQKHLGEWTVDVDHNDVTNPPLQQVWPSADATFEVGLDAQSLWKLAQALGCNQVRLVFHATGKDALTAAISVFPADEESNKARGCLMPFCVNLKHTAPASKKGT